jgi:hypothetical protein
MRFRSLKEGAQEAEAVRQRAGGLPNAPQTCQSPPPQGTGEDHHHGGSQPIQSEGKTPALEESHEDGGAPASMSEKPMTDKSEEGEKRDE